MRLMLLGGPGAGKGTQAQFLKSHFNIPQISTGDMLRAAIAEKSPLGAKVESVMAKGELVSDDLIISLVKERLLQDDCKNGFLFDGFPRTIAQADALKDANIALDAVIEIAVSDEEIIKRISGRRVHPGSGRIYHTIYNPPKADGVDDKTGDALIQRDDDKEETVKQRLEVYHNQTAPLVQYYENMAADSNMKTIFYKVSGLGSVEEISNKIITELGA